MATTHSNEEKTPTTAETVAAGLSTMATTHSNEEKMPTTAETVAAGAQGEPSSPPQQRSAPSSDDGSGSEAGEISASAVDSSGDAPALPDEAPPEDDGWYHEWEPVTSRWFFINRYTGMRQWENPRVPEANAVGYGSYDSYANVTAPGTTTTSGAPGTSPPPRRLYGGYNPSIHGSYDPNADYALEAQKEEDEAEAAAAAAATAAAASLAKPSDYTTAVHFNRFTGKFQNPSVNPDNHNDANKSRRQMTAFFDVDAAANSHDGRSLRAERRGRTLTKQELKAFKDKRRQKKEEKRLGWLKD